MTEQRRQGDPRPECLVNSRWKAPSREAADVLFTPCQQTGVCYMSVSRARRPGGLFAAGRAVLGDLPIGAARYAQIRRHAPALPHYPACRPPVIPASQVRHTRGKFGGHAMHAVVLFVNRTLDHLTTAHETLNKDCLQRPAHALPSPRCWCGCIPGISCALLSGLHEVVAGPFSRSWSRLQVRVEALTSSQQPERDGWTLPAWARGQRGDGPPLGKHEAAQGAACRAPAQVSELDCGGPH